MVKTYRTFEPCWLRDRRQTASGLAGWYTALCAEGEQTYRANETVREKMRTRERGKTERENGGGRTVARAGAVPPVEGSWFTSS